MNSNSPEAVHDLGYETKKTYYAAMSEMRESQTEKLSISKITS